MRSLLRRLGLLAWARSRLTPSVYLLENRFLRYAKPRSAMWLRGLERRYAPERVVAPAAPQKNSNLGRDNHFGADRMSFAHHNYAQAYSRLFQQYFPDAEESTICLIEVGILQGTGLALWCDYFPEARIIGLDHDLSHYQEAKSLLRERSAFRYNLPEVYQFDAYRPHSVENHAVNSVNIVIDDGPHTEAAIGQTAKAISPHLAERFLYIVEDNVSAGALVRDVLNELRPAQLFFVGGLAVIAPAGQSDLESGMRSPTAAEEPRI